MRAQANHGRESNEALTKGFFELEAWLGGPTLEAWSEMAELIERPCKQADCVQKTEESCYIILSV